jgi:ubiquinone/menaquinone biosynthesis C-methylase UbiE
MKKIDKESDIFAEILDVKGKVVVDVGCGTGNLIRWMTEQGATAVGTDIEEMIKKAKEFSPAGNERYIVCGGEKMLLEDSFADAIVYFASFHHISEDKLNDAITECKRVLKKDGVVIFVEPVAKEGYYYEVTKFSGDESEIQRVAKDTILSADRKEFEHITEGFYYMERSLENFKAMIKTHYSDPAEHTGIIEKGEARFIELANIANTPIKDFRLKSLVRLNILKKSV